MFYLADTEDLSSERSQIALRDYSEEVREEPEYKESFAKRTNKQIKQVVRTWKDYC